MIFRRSLVSELANSAGAVFTVIFSIVITIGLVRILGMAAGGRIDTGTVIEMVVYESLVNMAPLLAVSLFIAVLMTMTRCWLDSEMVVWFSSGGISLTAWIRPVLRFAIPIILLIGTLSLVISPWAKGQSDLNRELFTQRDDVSRLSPGRFIEIQSGRHVFFSEEVSEDGLSVKNVFLTQTARNQEMIVVASSGRIETNELGDRYIVLNNGRRYEGEAGTPEYKVTEFGSYSIRLDVKPDKVMAVADEDTRPLPMLWLADDNASKAEIMWRVSWPLAALNLILIAIPLSFTNPRMGRSFNMVIALLIFVLYLNGISVGKSLIEQGQLSLWTSVFAVNGIFTVIAILLFLRRTIWQRWLPRWMSLYYWRSRES